MQLDQLIQFFPEPADLLPGQLKVLISPALVGLYGFIDPFCRTLLTLIALLRGARLRLFVSASAAAGECGGNDSSSGEHGADTTSGSPRFTLRW